MSVKNDGFLNGNLPKRSKTFLNNLIESYELVAYWLGPVEEWKGREWKRNDCEGKVWEGSDRGGKH